MSDFPGGSEVKNLPAMLEMQEMQIGKIQAWQPTPVFLTWEIPWREELGGLRSTECKESDTTEAT